MGSSHSVFVFDRALKGIAYELDERTKQPKSLVDVDDPSEFVLVNDRRSLDDAKDDVGWFLSHEDSWVCADDFGDLRWFRVVNGMGDTELAQGSPSRSGEVFFLFHQNSTEDERRVHHQKLAGYNLIRRCLLDPLQTRPWNLNMSKMKRTVMRKVSRPSWYPYADPVEQYNRDPLLHLALSS
jgi:hypothetical protein